MFVFLDVYNPMKTRAAPAIWIRFMLSERNIHAVDML